MTDPVDAWVVGADPDLSGYLHSLAEHTIPLRRCRECGTHFVLPLPACPECAGDPEPTTSRGLGEVYTWVVVRHAFDDELALQVPYVVAAVELDEGARIFGRLEGIEIEQVAPGTRVRATFPDAAGRPPIVFVPEGGPR